MAFSQVTQNPSKMNYFFIIFFNPFWNVLARWRFCLFFLTMNSKLRCPRCSSILFWFFHNPHSCFFPYPWIEKKKNAEFKIKQIDGHVHLFFLFYANPIHSCLFAFRSLFLNLFNIKYPLVNLLCLNSSNCY